jgi:LPS sulfotransferase NodH
MNSYEQLKCFVLIIGNARSGSTLLGSIIDAHPEAAIANETEASCNFWRGLDRQKILDEIYQSSKNAQQSGRLSEGYNYSINKKLRSQADSSVMGDKTWNPATLLLHGDYALLTKLEDVLGVPVKIIHSIRNPFDVIATMHMRSGAPVADRALWYFMHCQAAQAINEHCHSGNFLDLHHETLLSSPDATISAICDFIGLDNATYPLEASKELLFNEAKKTRHNIGWNQDAVDNITSHIPKYPFLQQYVDEDYSGLAT